MRRLFSFWGCLLATLQFVTCTTPDSGPEQEFSGDAADNTAYTQKELPVIRNGATKGSIVVRFYQDLPSIPYVSAADFQALMLPGSTMKVSWKDGGLYELENGNGIATVNTAEESFSCTDYVKFTNLMDQVQKGMDNAYLDGVPFVHYGYQETSAPTPVAFDYAKYGIDLRGDGKAVYFPFTTLADLYADLYYHYAAVGADKVVVADRDSGDNAISNQDAGFSVESIMARERPADLAAYSYGEMCFVIDHFYGKPGRSPYEDSIASIGLDKTLEASEEGKQLKALLQSSTMADLAAGMDFLHIYLADGGHTHTWNGDPIVVSPDYPYMTQYPNLLSLYLQNYYRDNLFKALKYTMLQTERNSIFTDGATYHKKGDTAICHFDDFHNVNYPAWRAYYAGTGPLPTMDNIDGKDQMVIFRDALKKASEDPEVKNLVVDITMNTGGSLDLVMALTSLMYGKSFGRGINPLTGERILWYYDVDRNFDGVFDAKDKDVNYDLKFCVLTSRFAFSCGNLFPALCKDQGILIAGEKSGGGSCAVGEYRTPEGFQYQISSSRCRLANMNWENIDSGVVPDMVIEYGPDNVIDYGGVPVSMPSFAKFYDLDYLSSVMNAN